MASFAQAGGAIDEAIAAKRREAYNAEQAMKSAQKYQEWLGVKEGVEVTSDMLYSVMDQLATLKFQMVELKGEIDAIKMQMNMPANMGGYTPTGTESYDPTGAENLALPKPPMQPTVLEADYFSRLMAEGAVTEGSALSVF